MPDSIGSITGEARDGSARRRYATAQQLCFMVRTDRECHCWRGERRTYSRPPEGECENGVGIERLADATQPGPSPKLGLLASCDAKPVSSRWHRRNMPCKWRPATGARPRVVQNP